MMSRKKLGVYRWDFLLWCKIILLLTSIKINLGMNFNMKIWLSHHRNHHSYWHKGVSAFLGSKLKDNPHKTIFTTYHSRFHHPSSTKYFQTLAAANTNYQEIINTHYTPKTTKNPTKNFSNSIKHCPNSI